MPTKPGKWRGSDGSKNRVHGKTGNAILDLFFNEKNKRSPQALAESKRFLSCQASPNIVSISSTVGILIEQA